MRSRSTLGRLAAPWIVGVWCIMAPLGVAAQAGDAVAAEEAAATSVDEAPPGAEAATPIEPEDVVAQTESSGHATAGGGARIAVLVLAAEDADAEIADGVTEVLIGNLAALDDAPGSIIGKEELQSQLGQTELSSLDCLSSPTCLGRVGVQLEVDEVLAGTIRRHENDVTGSGWRFDLQRIDIHSGETVARVFEQVAGGVGELAGAMQGALDRLYTPRVELAVLALSPSELGAICRVDGEQRVYQGTPLRFELSAGAHEVSVRAEGFRDWNRRIELEGGATLQLEPGLVAIVAEVRPPEVVPVVPRPRGVSPWLYAGAGTTLLGGAVALGFGVSSRRTPSDGTNRADAIEFASDRRRDALITNVGFGIAAAGAVIGLIGALRSDFGEVHVAPDASGARVQFRGAF